MHKILFHNTISTSENTEERKSTHMEFISKKRNVDINKLLNRVKENEKEEFIKKLTLISIGLLVLSVFGFISVF